MKRCDFIEKVESIRTTVTEHNSHLGFLPNGHTALCPMITCMFGFPAKKHFHEVFHEFNSSENKAWLGYLWEWTAERVIAFELWVKYVMEEKAYKEFTDELAG